MIAMSLRSLFHCVLCIVLATGNGQPATAYVASSTNYRLQEDSVNMGGGLSTSTSYRTESTLGEPGAGTSSSATYRIKAGYQQMQETYLALTVPGNLSLSPDIPTTGGGSANASGAWTVLTDNAAGYTMTLRSSASPALTSGGNNFADYTPAGADPDYAWGVGAATSEFGFTAEGTDIVQKFKDNGVVCNAGSNDTTSACWKALATSAEEIARRTSGSHPSGTQTTIRFRAESGASHTQVSGSYSASVTLTVLPL